MVCTLLSTLVNLLLAAEIARAQPTHDHRWQQPDTAQSEIFSRTELFVSPNRSSEFPFPSCGETRATACSDFLDLMRKFCRSSAGKLTTQGVSRVLTLHLLPGVHSVRIPSQHLRPQMGTYLGIPLQSLDSCDFSDCAARLNIFGSAEDRTTILLTSREITSSSCGVANDTEDLRKKLTADYIDEDAYRSELGWIFLSFVKMARVQLENLTFRTEFPPAEHHNFFFFADLDQFRMENCHFPNLRRRAGAVLIAPSLESSDMKRYQFVRCKFDFVLTHDRDYPVSSDVKQAIKLFRPPQGSHQNSDQLVVEVRSCSFNVFCEARKFSAGQKSSGKSLLVSISGFYPDKEGFAIEADLAKQHTRVFVKNCSFSSSSPSGRSCHYPASAVFFQLREGTANLFNSTFTNLVNTKGLGSAIQVMGKGRKLNQTYEKQLFLQDVLFENNGRPDVARFGGALLICLENDKLTLNSITLQNVLFSNCSAKFGSALFASTYKELGVFPGHMAAPPSEMLAGTSMKDTRQLQTAVFLRNVLVIDNFAQVQGGIFAHQIGVQLHSGTVRGVEGSGVHLRNSLLTLSGKVEFISNRATDGAAICAVMKSRIFFENCHCSNFTFYNNHAQLRGGAIFIDKTSALEFDGDPFIEEVSPQSLRIIWLPCPIDFNKSDNLTEKLHFHGNKAVIHGDDMFIYSLLLCPKLQKQIDLLYSHNTELDGLGKKLFITGTTVNYLVFDGADTFCTKSLGSKTWLLKDCRMPTLRRLYNSASITPRAEALHKSMKQLNSDVLKEFYGRTLSSFDLFKPWNSSLLPLRLSHKDQNVDILDSDGIADIITMSKILHVAGSSLADITLLPSPGEQFTLNISCLDQIGNAVEAAVSIQVIPMTASADPFLQLCLQSQCGSDALTLGTNREFSNLSVIGPVGSQGWLQVSLNSDNHGDLLLLNIPFALSSCPLGFSPPGNNSSTTSCECSQNAAVRDCVNGKQIRVKSGMWVGSLLNPGSRDNRSVITAKPCQRCQRTSDEREIVCINGKLQDQHGWHWPQNRHLVYGECIAGYCNLPESETAGTTQTDTSVLQLATMFGNHQAQSVTQCTGHREGLLCGECEKGFSLTMYSKECVKCRGTSYIGVFATTFTIGLLLFFALLYWNWSAEMMTSFSSLYFFGQALTFTTHFRHDLPQSHKYISRSLNLDWSFGMCLTDNLNALTRLAWSYLAPVYLLSLVLLSLFLSRFYRLHRIFGRSTCIKMFWQFILLSLSSLASTSFQLLKCVPLSPKEAFSAHQMSNWRFADDASFECFAGDHLPWAIVATIIVGVFCIPLPLFLPCLDRYHRLKPFYDVYSSVYKDNRRWWCSVDLLRRLLLAAVYTAKDNQHNTHLAMCVITLSLLFSQCLLWPFKSWKANAVEVMFLFALSLVTILNGPQMTLARAVAIETIFFVANTSLFVYMAAERFLKHRIRFSQYGYGVTSTDGEDDGTMLREELLADVHPAIQYNVEIIRKL